MKYLLLLAMVLTTCKQSFSQGQLYSINDMSSVHLKKLAEEMKKSWTCPADYSDKKTQKSFCEIWQSRTDYLIASIRDNDFIHQPEISKLLDEIATELYEKNKSKIKSKPILLIDRSAIVNAYSIGNNIVVVNLGLINFCQYEEELAMVIAHEISHDVLDHSISSMKKKAEWLNSLEYKEFIKDLSSDKYNRVTKLVNTFKEYSYNRNKHGRYGESSADSLAVQFLLNTKYGFNAAYFLRLDSSDLEYKTPLKSDLQSYFKSYNIEINPLLLGKKGKGLSNKQNTFNNTNEINDTLKTHPDCIERFNSTKMLSSLNAPKTPINQSIKELSVKSMIWNLYRNGNLTAAMYRLLLINDRGINDGWTAFMFTNILISLYNEDAMLNRSNVINIKPKEYIGKDYYSLQNYFEQLPAEELDKVKSEALKFPLKNISSTEKEFRSILSDVSNNPQNFKYANKTYKKEIFKTLENNIYAEYFY
jgi:hypothetical protein